jgi:Flp pilus assembly pilin Flp
MINFRKIHSFVTTFVQDTRGVSALEYVLIAAVTAVTLIALAEPLLKIFGTVTETTAGAL